MPEIQNWSLTTGCCKVSYQDTNILFEKILKVFFGKFF